MSVLSALQYAPAAIGAASMGMDFAQKYGSSIKGMANNLFSRRKRQSAMDYMKGLTKPKGIKKLFTQDIPGAVKGASKLITSGKVMKGVKDFAGDAQAVLNVAQPLIGDKYHSQISGAIQKGVGQAQQWHDVANSYNEQGKQLANQFSQQIASRPRLTG